MEGCSVSRDPQGAGVFTTYALFLFSILTPISLMLFVFLSFLEYRILNLTRISVVGHTNSNSRRSAGREAQQDEMAPARMAYSTNLLDGGIEDIRIQPLRPLLMTPAPDENSHPLIGDPGDLLGSIVDNLKISALDPKHVTRIPLFQSRLRDAAQPNTNPEFKNETVSTVVKWDGKISWALKGSSIFNDADEEIDAFNARSNMLVRQPYSELWVFQYGLRYIPALSDRDVYRTIRIEELPREITMSQILPLIAGEVYCARLADTSSITGYNTAIVTFVTQKDAVNFVTLIVNRTLVLPFGKLVPVHTPTYPVPAETDRLITEEGYTRTLGVFHIRPTLKTEIMRVLNNSYFKYSLQLEAVENGPAIGEVSVKMLSVKAAVALFEWLQKHPSLCNCQFRFLRQNGTPSEGNAMVVGADSQTASW